MDEGFRLPDLSQRLAIVGRTGSGKTQFGAWALSKARFDIQPFIIVDYKRDALLGSIDRIKQIDFKNIPKQPGLYVIQPLPGEEDELEDWFWRIWSRENIGLFIDEGYSVPNQSKAWRAILTQGRSKHLPVIALSQRPSWVSRFIFSEADFFAFFQLSQEDDQKSAQSNAPKKRLDLSQRIPDYHCFWYDVSRDFTCMIKPVPDAETIKDDIDRRLSPKRKIA